MPELSPKEFVAKWSKIQQKETAVSQPHFLDVCKLVGHKSPIDHDPSGKNFSFETQTVKPDGAKGFADVFFRGKFMWEYKGPHADLSKAYQQLQLYREDLHNPPLLITSDIHRIIIHTNFNNYPTQKHVITMADLISGDGLHKLRWAFHNPEKFKPAKTQEQITKATAETLLAVAEQMKKHRDLLGGESYSNEQLAHFLVRLLFALFAEDMGLLPDNLFTQIVRMRGDNFDDLRKVLMEPLKRKWEAVRLQANRLMVRDPDAAYKLLADFAAEIAAMRVLDPACGSGNFLYVALRELLKLQKAVIAHAARHNLPPIELTVSPEQLYGIEINPYAHELAQITAWIGYLQWRNENGFADMNDPILRPLHNIQRMDAILAYDADGNPVEPEWPAADVIVGNPPFLGSSKQYTELSVKYVDDLRSVYTQLPGKIDFVCYWFEKARLSVKNNKVGCAGLIATQSIRAGASRHVLDLICETGNIFSAWSDRPWILDGANVRVSIVGFDNGTAHSFALDGQTVDRINSNLTSQVDLTQAKRLEENLEISFKGLEKAGPFDISATEAKDFIKDPNPDRRSNEDVIKPLINGNDITKRPRNMWVIDFGIDMLRDEAQKYIKPFQRVEELVKPFRSDNRRKRKRELWWIFGETLPKMRNAISRFERYIVTPRVAKHRLFVFLDKNQLPDTRIYVIARHDDYFFGVLHSRVHEVWSLATSSRHGVGNDPTYNNTTCFETFPFPWPPGQEPAESDDPLVAEIAHWARELVQWRDAWLNPPRDGMYAGLGAAYDQMLKKRTLTNLYNGLVYYRETVKAGQLFIQADFDKVTRKSVTRADIQELDDIHRGLDTAVLDAYGWPHTLTDEQILERLLALNLERANRPPADSLSYEKRK